MRAATDRPNIILINCDDLGYGDLGCYGSPCNATPAVDRLAREGLLLTDFYVAAPVCSPSRAAILTGCYPRRIGMDAYGADRRQFVLFPGDAEGLHPDEVTIAMLLRRQGYTTKLVGKWHVGDQREFLPLRHGFDEFYGLPYSNDMGMQIQYPAYPPLPLLDGEDIIEQQPDQATLTERYVEQCIRFLRTNRDRPFFLYLAHMYVHIPLFVPEHFLKSARNGPYGAAVECVDWATAALLHEVRRLGLDQNSLIIFTSDNGGGRHPGASNQPLRGHKGTTWEGGQRVPCLMRWPGVIPAGRRCDTVTTAMDFLPTFAALAGTLAPDDRVIDGRDLSSLLRGGTDLPEQPFLYYKGAELQAVRDGDWKLHLASGELYNLRTDVGEANNLAPDHPAEVARLARLANQRQSQIERDRRRCGRVNNPVPLTAYEANHPYIVAMYDTGGVPRPRREQFAQPNGNYNRPVIGPTQPDTGADE